MENRSRGNGDAAVALELRHVDLTTREQCADLVDREAADSRLLCECLLYSRVVELALTHFLVVHLLQRLVVESVLVNGSLTLLLKRRVSQLGLRHLLTKVLLLTTKVGLLYRNLRGLVLREGLVVRLRRTLTHAKLREEALAVKFARTHRLTKLLRLRGVSGLLCGQSLLKVLPNGLIAHLLRGLRLSKVLRDSAVVRISG